MTAQNRYITSLLSVFSTFLESHHVSKDLALLTTEKFIVFINKRKTDDPKWAEHWSIDDLEKFLTAENVAHKQGVLLKKFVAEYTPLEIDIYLHEFLSSIKADNRSNSTIKNYRSDIQQFVSLSQTKQISNLFEPENLRNFVHNQLDSGLKLSTIKRKLSSISQFALWAETEKIVQDASFWISDLESLVTGKPNYQHQRNSISTQNSASHQKNAQTELENFLISLEIDGHSQATIKNYKSDLNQFFESTGESVLDKIITQENIENFVVLQRKTGLKPSSIKRKVTSITQFSLWAQDRSLIERVSSWIHLLQGQLFETQEVIAQDHSRVGNQTTTVSSQRETVSTHSIIPNAKFTTSTPQKFELKLKPNTLVHAHQTNQNQVKHGWKLPVPDFAAEELEKKSGNTTKSEKELTNGEETRKIYAGIRSSLKDFANQINTKRNKQFLPYLNLVMMVIFAIGLGVLGYQQFIKQAPTPFAYPSTPVRPNRELSFQGRLTDTAQNPITTSTDMAFRLYDNSSGGTQLWSSGTCSVTPDQDGIFNVGLGDDCGSEITEDVFTENSNVWLEVEIESETLDPRQSIKTVAYALNSETVQGYPVSATGAATTNTILTMDAGGQVLLGEVSPSLKATSGSFTIEAQALVLQTSSGSNGNITLAPDGTGKVIVQSDLDLEGYLHAPGATFSATYAGGTALIAKGGPSGTANIQEWQNSAGTTLSYVDNSGNVIIPDGSATSPGIGFATSPTLGFYKDTASEIAVTTGSSVGRAVFGTNTIRTSSLGVFGWTANSNATNGATTGLSIISTGTVAVGNGTQGDYSGTLVATNIGIGSTSPGYALDVVGELNLTDAIRVAGDAGTSGYLLTSSAGGANTWTDPSSITGAGYWANTLNVLHPKNEYASVVDLALGGTSTASAKFQVFGNSGRAKIDLGSDSVGLTIQGDASQTQSLTEWQNSGGTALSRISSAGVIQMNQPVDGTVMPLVTNNNFAINRIIATGRGQLSLGYSELATGYAVGSPAQYTTLSVGNSYDPGSDPLATITGAVFNLTKQQNSAFGAYGINVSTNINTGNASTDNGSNIAGRFFAQTTGSARVGSLFSVLAQARNSSSDTTSSLVGLYAYTDTYGTGLVSSAESIRVGGSGGGTGTKPSTTYGIRVFDQDQGTSANYSIVTNAGNAVFNEGGDANTDFRIESDTDINALFVDASANNVGIGTATPAQKLSVNGNIHVQSGNRVTARTDGTYGLYLSTTNISLDSTSHLSLSTLSPGNISLTAGGSGNLAFSSTTGNMTVATAGNIGLGTTSPVGKLNLVGAVTGKALAIFNETGDQAIFVASASGTNRFIIQNDGNVGIGSASPAYKLDVAGTINLTSALYANGNAGSSGFLLTSSGGGANTWTDPSSITGAGYWANTLNVLHPKNEYASVVDLALGGTSTASANIHLQSNGKAYFAGNVGIGTTSTGNLLTLSSTGSLGWDNGSGTVDVSLSRDAANTLGLRNSTSAQKFKVYNTYTSSSNYESFDIDWATTANTVILRTAYGASGNVARDILIQPQTQVTPNQAGADITLQAGHGASSGIGGDVFIYGGNGGSNIGGGSIVATTGTPGGSAADSGALTLSTGNSQSSNTSSSGAVSISSGTTGGTTSGDTGSITIKSGNSSSSNAGSNSGNVTLQTGSSTSGTAGSILFNTDGTNERMRISAAGNVGIGSASPAYKLDVAGTFNLTSGFYANGDAGTSGYFLTSSGGGANTWTDPDTITGAGWWANTLNVFHPKNEYASVVDLAIGGTSTASADIQLYSNGSAVFNEQGNDSDFRIEASGVANAFFVQGSDGNIGIGTNNPIYPLYLTTSSSSIARFKNIMLRTTADNSGSGLGIYGDSAAGGIGFYNYNGSISLKTATGGTPTDRLSITSDGNVGIGTTAPIGKLNVSGAATGKANTIINETGDQAIFAASASGTNRFIIQNDGNVGIGTTSPVDKLTLSNGDFRLSDSTVTTTSKFNTQGVATNGNHSLLLNGAAADRPEIAFYRGNNQYPQLAIRMHTTNDQGGSIWAGSGSSTPTEALTIRESGNIGIGSTAPSYKLDVTGTGRFTGAVDLDADLELNSTLTDVNGSVGTSGQILSSTGSGVDWIDVSSIGYNSWTIADDDTDTYSIVDGNILRFTSSDSNILTNLTNGDDGDENMDFSIRLLGDAVAGAGLTGGADNVLVGADSDVTFTIGAGNGITVNADDVAVNQAYNFAWTGTHSWSNTADFNGNVSIADTNIALDGASTTLTSTGAFTLTPGGAVTLGDGGDTMYINTSDWDISTTGVFTGVSGITTDGAYTQSGTSANTFTGTSTFSNATYSALFTGGNVGIGTATPTSGLHVYQKNILADQGNITANRGIVTITEKDNSDQNYRYLSVLQEHWDAASQAGAMVITIPDTTNTMMTIKISGYNYTSGTTGAWEAIISGYWYNTGDNWINTSTEIRGKAPFSRVRLMRDNSGTTPVIVLGDTTTTWEYPQINVDVDIAGFGGQSGMATGWAATLSTDISALTTDEEPGLAYFWDTSGNLGIGTTVPGGKLDVGSSSQFRVSSTGDITKIKNLAYTWPSSHTTDGVLRNDGSGNLTWATLGAAAITPDSLDFTEFKDAMALDATTTVAFGAFNYVHNLNSSGDFIIQDNGTAFATFADDGSFTLDNLKLDGNTLSSVTSGGITLQPLSGQNLNVTLATTGDFAVNTNQLYVDTSAGNVGIGTTAPTTTLGVVGNINATTGYYYGGSGSPLSVDLSRAVPTTVDDYIEIGNITVASGGHNYRISATVSSSGFSVAKQYVIPVKYGGTSGNWQTLLPISDTGVYSGNDFAIDINATTTTATLRIRRTAGASAGTASVRVESVGITTDVFTATSATGSTTAPTAFYNPLYQNVGTGNVGIGTATPVANLNIFQNSPTPNQILFQIGTDADSTRFTVDEDGDVSVDNDVTARTYYAGNGTVGGPTFSFASDTNTGLYRPAIDTIGIVTAGTEKVTIDANGNVGIGSTAPGYALDLVGEFNLTDAIRVAGNAGTSGYLLTSSGGGAMTWTDPASIATSATLWANTLNVFHPKNEYASVVDLAIGGTSTASADIQLYSNGSAVFNEQGNDSDFRIESDTNANAFFLDGLNANIGIGTNTTLSALQIHRTSSASQLFITTDTNVGSANDASLFFQSDNDGTPNPAGLGQYNDGSLRFTGGGSLVSPDMVITDAGNIGIGTTSPGQKLDVAGEIELANYLYFGNAGTEYLRWNSSDFILSDDLLPAGDGDSNLGSDSVRWNSLYVKGASIHIGNSGDEGILTYNTTDNYFGFDPDADATAEFVITSTGNVGIGTTVPSSFLLEVAGNIGPTADDTYSLGSASRRFTNIYSSGDIIASGISDADGDTKIQVEESADEDYIRFDTAGTERLVIDNIGKVGIGTATPTHGFEVNTAVTGKALVLLKELGDQDILTASNSAGVTRFRMANTGYLYAERFSDVSNSSYYVDPAGGTTSMVLASNAGIGTTTPGARLDVRNSSTEDILNLFDGSTEVFTVLDGGNVGIGSTAPIAKLDIANSADVELYFSGDTGVAEIKSDQDINFTMDADNDGSNHAFKFLHNASTELMRLTDTGNLGIGTTSPTSQLHVVKTNSSGSGDYIGFMNEITQSVSGAMTAYGYRTVTGTTHTSGTLSGLQGNSSQLKFWGNGGTTSYSEGLTSAADVYTGAIVDNLALVRVYTPGVSGGTINHLKGIQIANMNVGSSSNYSVYSEGGNMYHEGNIGIGTTTSDSKLHVVGVGRDSTPNGPGFRTGEDLSGNYAIELTSGGGIPHLDFQNDIGGTDYDARIGLYGDDYLVIDGANVGIGTTAPSRLLVVEKNQDALTSVAINNTASGTSAATTLLVAGGDNSLTLSSYSDANSSSFAGTNLISSYGGGLNIMTGGGIGNTINFGHSYISNSYYMSIVSGNIGIGTTAPGTILHIADPGDSRIRMENTDVDGHDWSWANDWNALNGFSLIEEGVSGNVMFVEAGGNIGLSTSTPQTRLHVNGALTVGDAPVAIVTAATGDIIAGDSTGGFQFDASANDMYAQQSTANSTGVHFNIRKSRGSAASPSVVTTGDDILLLRAYGRSASSTWSEAGRITFDTEGTISGAIVPGILRFYTQSTAGSLTERMVIDSDGNVGIGSTSPGQKLVVSGNIQIGAAGYIDDDATMGENSDDWIHLNGYIELKSNTSNYGIVLRDDSSTDYFGITQEGGYSILADSNTSVNYFLRGNGTNVDIAGNLGIGTTTASQVLDVVGGGIVIEDNTSSSTNAYKIERGGTDYSVLWMDTDQVYLNNPFNNVMNFRTNNTTRLTIGSTGIIYAPGVYNTTSSTRNVYVNSDGQLGYLSSSIKNKTNVENIQENTSKKLYDLRPVKFEYKDSLGTIQYGLIAEEVAQTIPEMAFYDTDGSPAGVSYQFLAPLLLSEIQKHQIKLKNLENNNIMFDSIGGIVITQSGSDYIVTESKNNNVLSTIIGARSAILGIIQAGLTNTKELIVENTATIKNLSAETITINGQSLVSYIQSVVGNQTASNNSTLVSPVGNDTVITATNSGKVKFSDGTKTTAEINKDGNLSLLGNLNSKDVITNSIAASGSSTLGSLLVQGDATVSGTLTAQNSKLGNLLANEVSISGTLVAQNATISGTAQVGTLLANEVTAASARISALEAGIAQLESVRATTADLVTATVSGTLYANSIYDFENKVATTLQQPGLLDILLGTNESTASASFMEDLYATVNKSEFNASSSADLDLSFAELSMTSDDVVLTGSALFVEKYLKVNGGAYVSDSLAIGNDLFVGDSMLIADGLIRYTTADPANQILKIQPEGQGSIELLAGIVTIDDSGKVTVNGDLDVTGNAKIAGTLLTNMLKPTEFGNPLQVQVAGVDTQTNEVKKSRFEIINEVGTPVATFSAEGNAAFAGKVDIAGGIGLESQNLGSSDTNELSTNKTSGKATIKAGSDKVTIKSGIVTNDSLVYVTAVGSTDNKVLFVKSQAQDDPNTPENEGEFVVGFDSPASADVSFNWWIVN